MRRWVPLPLGALGLVLLLYGGTGAISDYRSEAAYASAEAVLSESVSDLESIRAAVSAEIERHPERYRDRSERELSSLDALVAEMQHSLTLAGEASGSDRRSHANAAIEAHETFEESHEELVALIDKLSRARERFPSAYEAASADITSAEVILEGIVSRGELSREGGLREAFAALNAASALQGGIGNDPVPDYVANFDHAQKASRHAQEAVALAEAQLRFKAEYPERLARVRAEARDAIDLSRGVARAHEVLESHHARRAWVNAYDRALRAIAPFVRLDRIDQRLAEITALTSPEAQAYGDAIDAIAVLSRDIMSVENEIRQFVAFAETLESYRYTIDDRIEEVADYIQRQVSEVEGYTEFDADKFRDALEALETAGTLADERDYAGAHQQASDAEALGQAARDEIVAAYRARQDRLEREAREAEEEAERAASPSITLGGDDDGDTPSYDLGGGIDNDYAPSDDHSFTDSAPTDDGAFD